MRWIEQKRLVQFFLFEEKYVFNMGLITILPFKPKLNYFAARFRVSFTWNE